MTFLFFGRRCDGAVAAGRASNGHVVLLVFVSLMINVFDIFFISQNVLHEINQCLLL